MKKWLIRKYNGSLGGLYSKKVEGLKGRPHLNNSIFNMGKSDKNIWALINCLKQILEEKGAKCNFENFYFSKPVNDEIISNFIEELITYVETFF